MSRIEQVRDWLKDFAGHTIDATAAHIEEDGAKVGAAVAAAEDTAHRLIEYVLGHGVPMDEAAPVGVHITERIVGVEVPDQKGE